MCIFCKIAAGEIPTHFLYESANVVAFNDLDPQAPTHILIIPRAHFENAAELAAADSATMSELFGAARELASSLGLDGYRITLILEQAQVRASFTPIFIFWAGEHSPGRQVNRRIWK